jgi:hypothetical protein
MENENTELAVPAESNPLAIPLAELDEMFGESAPDEGTPLSFNNLAIVRETAQFEIADDEYVPTLVGHILYKHKAKQYFDTKYDPSNPAAPVCYSINGTKPVEGCKKPQTAGLCKDCPMNAYKTAETGDGKACKDTIRFLFMREGSVLPVTVIAPPTSLSKKGPLQAWLNSVMDDVAKAYTAIGMTNKKKGPIVDYWWAKVELSLDKKTFDGGVASILKVKTLDVLIPDTDENLAKVRALHQSRLTFNGVYLDELHSHIEKVDADPISNEMPVAGTGNESQSFNDEPIEFDINQEIPA